MIKTNLCNTLEVLMIYLILHNINYHVVISQTTDAKQI